MALEEPANRWFSGLSQNVHLVKYIFTWLQIENAQERKVKGQVSLLAHHSAICFPFPEATTATGWSIYLSVYLCMCVSIYLDRDTCIHMCVYT